MILMDVGCRKPGRVEATRDRVAAAPRILVLTTYDLMIRTPRSGPEFQRVPAWDVSNAAGEAIG
jgi:hypothetical protein